MQINFNVTGSDRKSLVGAISEILNTPTKYLGAPSFSYEVGDYTIDKTGTLEFSDRTDSEEVENLLDGLAARGFECEPAADGREPRYTEEEFGFGVRRTDPVGEDGMRADDVPEPDEPDRLTIEVPLVGFTPDKLDNLSRLVNSKHALICKALGTDILPIQMTETTIKFPWFRLCDDADFAAYAQFIAQLCKTAKEKKRVTARIRESYDNEKFTMRVFLIGLGMVGSEYGAARKLLMRNLSGNSAFRYGKQPIFTAHCYTYPNGSEEDAMDCETTDFSSLAKAKACCDAFLQDCESVKFAGAHVEDENGKYVYEILTDGTEEQR
jgi:hypothetical protein